MLKFASHKFLAPSNSSLMRWRWLLLLCYFLAPVISAALYVLSFPPYNQVGCIFLAITPMLIVLRRLSFWRGLLLAYVAGTCYAVGIAPFVYGALHDHYEAGVFYSALFTLFILGGVMSFFFTAPIMLWRALVGRVGASQSTLLAALARVLLAASIFFLFEKMRSHGVLSLPWGLFGAGLSASPVMIQFADTIGTLGLSFLVIFVSALIYEALEMTWTLRLTNESKNFRSAMTLCGLVVALLAFLFVYGSWRLAGATENDENSAGPSIKVALVQSNISHERRWNAANIAENLAAHLQLSDEVFSQANLPELVIWAESSVNLYLHQGGELVESIFRFARSKNTHLLLGAPDLQTTDAEVAVYNAAYLVEPSGRIDGQYNKIQLLPFAEYNPLGQLGVLPQLGDAPRLFTPGTDARALRVGGEQKTTLIAPLICYEALYPWVARAMVLDGAEILVNISNDQLFNGPVASKQHSQQTRLRAVETRRYFTRTALTGISLMYDPWGRLYQGKILPVNERGVLNAELPLLKNITPYVRFGDWPLLLIAISCIATALVMRLQRMSAVQSWLKKLGSVASK